MTATVQPCRAGHHGQHRDSAHLRAEDVFARLTGRSVKSAHDRLCSLPHDNELAVQACLEAGAPERAVWLLARAMVLLDAPTADSLDAACVEEAEAEGAEDVACERFRIAPTDANRRTWERAVHREIARLLAKLAASRVA